MTWHKDLCPFTLHGGGSDPTDYNCAYEPGDGHEKADGGQGRHAELDGHGEEIHTWTTTQAVRSRRNLL